MIDVWGGEVYQGKGTRSRALWQGWGSVHTPGHLTAFACADNKKEAPKQRTR